MQTKPNPTSLFTVPLPNGETVKMRTLTNDEFRRLKHVTKLQDNSFDQAGFVIGKVLTDDNGTQAFPQRKNETDLQFSRRVLQESGIDYPTVEAILTRVGQVHQLGVAILKQSLGSSPR